MSINNLDYTSYNYLTNLASVNANEVNTDVLTKSDPDITDLQFDMLEGINTNETIQDQIDNVTFDITALEADVLTLQGEMITANSNISTLQFDVSTLEGEVTALDGEVTTLQGQVSTLNGEVNTLQSEMNTAQADIGALYGISSTNTAAIAGLSISQAAQDVIITSHTGSIATLQGEMTTAQGQIAVLQTKTTDISYGALTGTTFARRVYITNTGLGVGTDSVYLASSEASTFLYGISATGNISTAGTLTSTSGTSQVSSLLVNNNFEVTNSSFFGDTIYVDRAVLTSAKKVVLYDNSTGNDYDYLGFWTDSGTASKKFLNAEIDGVSGSAFQWYYGNGLGSSRTLAKSLSSADEINYTPQATFLKSAGASQQIQLVRDTANNRVRIDMIGDIAGANAFDGQIIQQEGNGVDDNRGIMTIQSGDVTITAQTSATTGTLQMNMKVLDINASDAITIDGATTTTITSVDDMTLQTTNPFGDILITSAGTTTLTSVGQTQVNSAELDINATGALTVDSDGGMTFTETSGTMYFNKTGASGGINFQSANFVSIDAADEFFLVGGGVAQMTSTGSTVTLTANQKIELNATNGNVDIRAFATDVTIRGDQLLITTDSLTSGIVHNSAASSNWDMDLKNALNAYGMRLSETGTGGLTLLGVDDGINQISSNGVNSSLNIISGGDIGMSATDIVIEATGTSTGSIDIIANEALDLFSTLDAINLTSGLDTNINAVTIKLDATTQILHHIGGVEVQEIGASGIINNPTGTITNQISGVDKLTISSTTVAVINNLTVSQTNYAQPMSSAFQLGYTNTLTGSTIMTVTLAQRATFSIPQKGVWLIVLGYQWTGGGANTVTLKRAIISATTASSTPAAPGLRYYEEIDIGVTAALQQQGTITGVYTATAATSLFLNASGNVNTGTFPTLGWEISWTRIG